MKRIHWAAIALIVVVPGVIVHSYGVVSGKTSAVATGISTAVSTPVTGSNIDNSQNIPKQVTPTKPAAQTPVATIPTATTPKTVKQPAPAPPAQTPTATPAPTQTSPDATPPSSNGSDIAPDSACPGEGIVSQAQTVLACMTSYARTQHGLGPVTGNQALMDAATAKAQDIINCGFSHTACGHEFYYWMVNKGYTGNCLGENIAQGQSSPLEVFTAWMNSPGHKANILNVNFKDIGIAGTNSSQGVVWVMELGGC